MGMFRLRKDETWIDYFYLSIYRDEFQFVLDSSLEDGG